MATGMSPQIDLIRRRRHMAATRRSVMNLVVAVVLGILVDDVLRHKFTLSA
jgi:hypothetical protein